MPMASQHVRVRCLKELTLAQTVQALVLASLSAAPSPTPRVGHTLVGQGIQKLTGHPNTVGPSAHSSLPWVSEDLSLRQVLGFPFRLHHLGIPRCPQSQKQT